MGLNDTPQAERKHISFFGCRNAGKSSLINAVTNQSLSIVSDVPGTTTDPVHKAMELLPVGPVVITDTPGLDDVGTLGEMRVQKAEEVLRRTDLAILVIDASVGMTKKDKNILSKIKDRNIPFILAYNKMDKINGQMNNQDDEMSEYTIFVSALNNAGIKELKEMIGKVLTKDEKSKTLVGDLVKEGEIVVLVVPIDKAAPKGRLILPQQETIRDLLDHRAIPLVCGVGELQSVIDRFQKDIALVITDSQAFKKVGEIVPKEIPLTSFSILFSRYKGELDYQLDGVKALRKLEDGDKILIAEGCTHHRQCGDIGTEKIPALLRKKADVVIDFCHGTDFPDNLKEYKLIIHCGACMLNDAEMKARIAGSKKDEIPMTNYGMVIAEMTGILERSMEILTKSMAKL